MGELYTSGTWTVRPGKEEEFVTAWNEFANWTTENIPGAGWAILMQSKEAPNRFVSVGPWESEEAITSWRESEGFQQRLQQIRALLEDFQPGLYESRVNLGDKR